MHLSTNEAKAEVFADMKVHLMECSDSLLFFSWALFCRTAAKQKNPGVLSGLWWATAAVQFLTTLIFRSLNAAWDVKFYYTFIKKNIQFISVFHSKLWMLLSDTCMRTETSSDPGGEKGKQGICVLVSWDAWTCGDLCLMWSAASLSSFLQFSTLYLLSKAKVSSLGSLSHALSFSYQRNAWKSNITMASPTLSSCFFQGKH